MDSINKTWNISVQQVQLFLKAVELKNFTQVGNFFNFSPSMVSKTISSMEDELRLKLFIRKPNELTPTKAAELLSKEWKQFIASFNNSIEKAQTYEHERKHKITLGFVDSSSKIDKIISRAILEYSKSRPNIKINAEKHDMHRLVELLNSGMLDIVQTSEMEIPYLDEHSIPWEKAFDSMVAIYVPRGNSLFVKDFIDIEDIKTQSIISLDPVMHTSYHHWLLALCKKHGFIPNIANTYRTVRSLLFSLKMHDYLFIGDTVTSDWCDDNLKLFVLPEKSFSLFAWRKESRIEIAEFKEFLKKMYLQKY